MDPNFWLMLTSLGNTGNVQKGGGRIRWYLWTWALETFDKVFQPLAWAFFHKSWYKSDNFNIPKQTKNWMKWNGSGLSICLWEAEIPPRWMEVPTPEVPEDLWFFLGVVWRSVLCWCNAALLDTLINDRPKDLLTLIESSWRSISCWQDPKMSQCECWDKSLSLLCWPADDE